MPVFKRHQIQTLPSFIKSSALPCQGRNVMAINCPAPEIILHPADLWIRSAVSNRSVSPLLTSRGHEAGWTDFAKKYVSAHFGFRVPAPVQSLCNRLGVTASPPRHTKSLEGRCQQSGMPGKLRVWSSRQFSSSQPALDCTQTAFIC